MFNAPYSNTRSVAELVLAEAILLLRGAREERRGHRAAGPRAPTTPTRSAARPLGIVGYGSIGTQLSVLAEALGMHVAF